MIRAFGISVGLEGLLLLKASLCEKESPTETPRPADYESA